MSRNLSWRTWVGLIVATVLVAGVAEAATKAVIVIEKQAKSKGEIVFGVTPAGGEEQEITITVVEKMNPQEIAADVAKELSFALSETFNVKQNGAKVEIKPLEKKATFDLAIKNQTVQGISVTIK